jgi:hypothetical protein
VGVLVGVAFWGPPLVLAVLLFRHDTQQSDRHLGGTVLASLLGLVAWWFVLVGVGGGLVLVLSDLVDRHFHDAALVLAPLLVWFAIIVLVFRRGRRKGRSPHETVNVVALWATGLALPLVGLTLMASAV